MTKRDHKRKARPIGPATVTVTPDAITVVVPDVLGKNESHQGGRFLSPATKAYREAVRLAVARGLVGKGWSIPYGGAFARSGAWRLEVLAVWPRQRSTINGKPIDFGTAPMGDTDAAIAQSLDALQHAGILDDDARVVEVRAWAMWRQNVRATIIRLVRVENRGRHLADAAQHLIDIALEVPEQKPPPPTLFSKPKTTRDKANADSIPPCAHPERNGRHELYMDKGIAYCRACGYRKPRRKAATT